LAYYRNQILHIFVAEAFVACALESFACRRQADQGVSRADLLEETTFLSRLFKREFIYKPSPDAEDNFDETLEAMRRRKILSLSDDDQMVTADPEGHKMLAFLRHLFRPFIDSYWVAALSLFTLRAERKMEEKQFIKIMQEYAESLYQQGELRYSDAVSMENLSNALSLYKDLGIVKDEMPAQGDKRSSRNRQITLCESHITGQSLSEFVNRIGKFSSSNQAPVIAERVQKILEKSQATMA
jgi:glycerol-3-phosphate O-acyltransferase